MPAKPRYWGTKQGKIVIAIAVDSIKDWKGLQSTTQFSENELNYHLFLLFQDGVLKKSESQYYLIPSLEADYQEYVSPAPKVTRIAPKESKVSPIQAMKKEPRCARAGSRLCILSYHL